MNYYEGARRGGDNPMAISLQAQQMNLQLSDRMAQRMREENDTQMKYQAMLNEQFARFSEAELPGPSKTLLLKKEKEERQRIVDKLREYGGDVRKFMAYGGSTMLAEYASNIRNSKEWNNGIQSKLNEQLIREHVINKGLVPHRVRVTKDGQEQEIPLEDAISAYNGQNPDFKLDHLPYAGAFTPVDMNAVHQSINQQVDPHATLEERMNGVQTEMRPETLEEMMKAQNYADWYITNTVENYRNKLYGKAKVGPDGRYITVNPYTYALDQRAIAIKSQADIARAKLRAAEEKAKDKQFVGELAGMWVPQNETGLPSALHDVKSVPLGEERSAGTIKPKTFKLGSMSMNQKTLIDRIPAVNPDEVYVMVGGKMVRMGDASQIDQVFGTQNVGRPLKSVGNVPLGNFKVTELSGTSDNTIWLGDKMFVRVNLLADSAVEVDENSTDPVKKHLGPRVIRQEKNGALNKTEHEKTEIKDVWVMMHRPSDAELLGPLRSPGAGVADLPPIIDQVLNSN